MNIQILDSWLREYVKTNATPEQLAECLSLCGPSVEKIEKRGNDYWYDIEITTNRVDSMSIIGLAQEAAAILPQFGIKAELFLPKPIKPATPKTSLPLTIKSTPKLTKRVMGIVLTNIQNGETPDWMKRRLEASGIRSLNSVVDITNYIMTEIGHPTHVFDYDQLTSKEMVFRESKKGETLISLDKKKHILPGGDIVIDNGKGEIIDLPGIMGTLNTVVNSNTKSILFFIDNNDPVKIRNTSMNLAIRSVAATLNEKGVDPELAELALLRGIKLYQEICGATIASKIYDYYPKRYESKSVEIEKSHIKRVLGIDIEDNQINKILEVLGFGPKWKNNRLRVQIPSWRALDISIPEDLIEEIARIYGYHNLPSKLMVGALPTQLKNSPFLFESKIKNILKTLGGMEVYTLSLVPKTFILNGEKALKLRNPLGSDAEYLRNSLTYSLLQAADQNKGAKEPLHLFEVANIYLPKTGTLPEERMMLAGIIMNCEYRNGKGVTDALLKQLHIDFDNKVKKSDLYINNECAEYIVNTTSIGRIGLLKGGSLYYEFEIEKLKKYAKDYSSYIQKSIYPAQIEDMTLILPNKVKIHSVIQFIKAADRSIVQVELIDIFEEAYTVRIWYQSNEKTLSDQEVEGIRQQLLATLKKRFEVKQK